MKKIATNLSLLLLGAVALTACDAKNDPIDNMVYISEAATSPITEIEMGAPGTTSNASLTVRMAQVAQADTKVQLALDAATLESYNRRNDTEYKVIPSEYITFPREVTIEKGSSSTIVNIEVKAFNGDKGVEYAAPIKITSAQSQEISRGSGSYIYTFGVPLTQMCPQFAYDNSMKMNWENETELSNLTLEWWVRVVNPFGNGGFSVNNQALFDFKDNNDPKLELYVRFGDVVYSIDGTPVYNYLQIKTLGIDANYDSGDPANNPLKWGEWIHFAHTYDASSGDVVLYMNGKEVNRSNGGAGKVFKFSGLTMCSSGMTYFRDYIEMAQVRLWKTTRTANQISSYMKKEVKYDDPNLVFYLPMNEGQGSVLHDVTGNGHDVIIGSADNGTNPEANAWTQYTF